MNLAKISLTLLSTLSLNMLWGQWVEKATGFTTQVKGFEKISCPDELTCYTTSDYQVLKTVDGGDNWVDRTSNIPISIGLALFENIVCSDPNTCICIYGNSIYKTEDGALSWTSVSSDMGSLVFKMIDAQYGYSNIGNYQLAKTDDFGNTWTSFSYLTGIPFNVQDISTSFDFITPDIGIMAFDANSRNAQELYKTINGGLNWSKVFDSIDAPVTFVIWGLDMVTTQVGYMTTTQGDVYKTTNGAETWVYLTKLTGGMDVEFIDENNGYVSSMGKMFKTTNGGESWIEESTPINTTLPEIEIVNYDLVYVSAGYNVIFKNSDANLIANIFDLHQNHIGRIYPNPAIDEITIELYDNTSGLIFQLFDLMGNRMINQSLNENKTTLQRGNIPSGLYFFRITNKNTLLGTGKLLYY